MRLLTFALTLLLFVAGASAPAQASNEVEFYVSPLGNDKALGTSIDTPFRTIQRALDLATPGTVINLARGSYTETVATKIDGFAGSPIVIRGTDNAKTAEKHQTVLFGSGRILSVNHSYYRFEGFAIDGQAAIPLERFPADPAQAVAFKDSLRGVIEDGRLVYIGAGEKTRDITGVKIDNMFLHGAGGECVRIRNAASYISITNSVVQWCGMFAKESKDRYSYHNAEGIYIGTSPQSKTQPMYLNDTTNNVMVSKTVIHTYGSECFDVKENAHHNTLKDSECRFNLEPMPDGSSIELRGHSNMLIGNKVTWSASYHVKIRSDDQKKYANGGNIVVNNSFSLAAGGAFNLDTPEQGAVCGNSVFRLLGFGDQVEGDEAETIAPFEACTKTN